MNGNGPDAATSVDDLGQRELDDVAGAGVLEGGDQRVDLALGDHGLDRVAALRRTAPTRSGAFIDGTSAITRSRSAWPTLSFTSTLPRASSTPSSSVLSCSMAWRLAGSAYAAGLAMQRGEAGQDLADDLEAGGPQRPAGLGAVDDAVDDVGHLGLGGAVRQADVGLGRPGRRRTAGSAAGTRSRPGRRRAGPRPCPTASRSGTATTMRNGLDDAFEYSQLAQGHDVARRSPRPSRGR